MSSSSLIERSGRLWSTRSSVLAHSAEDQSDQSQQAPHDDENLLHIAAWGKRTKIAEALLGHGLDVNKRDDMLRTPVIVATTHQQFEVMRLLLERGADASVFEEFQFFRQSYDDGESYSIAVRLFGNRLTASALNETPDVLAGVEDVRTGGWWEEWSILVIPNKEDAGSGSE
ncbi:hypothetical protein CIB48_g5459 [Xylaria polymorpha]|nr:hypothetical protein CIB48_g5459 [Xylaria polymorpha]